MTQFRLAAAFLMAGILAINTAYPHSSTTVAVPFENIYLNPSQTLQASYSFGAHPVIFCFANNTQNNGTIYWPYQGLIYNQGLPVFLKINGQFEGQFADANGTIQITNTTGKTLQVGCLYAY